MLRRPSRFRSSVPVLLLTGATLVGLGGELLRPGHHVHLEEGGGRHHHHFHLGSHEHEPEGEGAVAGGVSTVADPGTQVAAWGAGFGGGDTPQARHGRAYGEEKDHAHAHPSGSHYSHTHSHASHAHGADTHTHPSPELDGERDPRHEELRAVALQGQRPEGQEGALESEPRGRERGAGPLITDGQAFEGPGPPEPEPLPEPPSEPLPESPSEPSGGAVLIDALALDLTTAVAGLGAPRAATSATGPPLDDLPPSDNARVVWARGPPTSFLV